MGLLDVFGKDAINEESNKNEPQKSTSDMKGKRQRKKAGYIILSIAGAMFMLSLSMGGNPFAQVNGTLFWGLLITISFLRLTDKQYRIGIGVTIALFLLITALMSVPYSYPTTHLRDTNNGSYEIPDIDQAFIWGMNEKLPPIDSDLNKEEKRAICLEIAETYYLYTNTDEQKEYFCNDYAEATQERMDAMQQYFIDVMDNSTPQERYDWCLENREMLFGDRDMAYAALVCETFKTDWETVRESMYEQMIQ